MPLVRGPLAAPADIMDHQLVHVIGYGDDWHRWLRLHVPSDVAVPRGLLVDGSLIAIEAAQRGDGIMLGRRPFIDQFLDSGELVEAFAKPYHLQTEYYLRERPETKARRASKTVANWLIDLASQESKESGRLQRRTK